MQYRAPWWMPDGHSQTILAARVAPKPKLQYHRVRWATPDDDFLDLDFTVAPEQWPSCKRVWVLFHGLEGCSRSHYSLAVMHKARSVGALGVVVHFRGCSGENNRRARAYHSGDSQEMDWILRRLRGLFQGCRMGVVGVSLGGNVLLKWLGEQGHSALKVVDAAVSVSAPVDLLAGANSLAKGFNRVYTRMFLSTLIPKAVDKVRRIPGLGQEADILACRDFFDFDDRVTAPWHGFKNARDYYQRCSAKPLLRGIEVPTAMVHALNDPFMPGQHLPKASELSPHIRAVFPRHGGHVGFPGGAHPLGLTLDWLPMQVSSFFQEQGA